MGLSARARCHWRRRAAVLFALSSASVLALDVRKNLSLLVYDGARKSLGGVLRRGDVISPLMTFGGGALACSDGSMDALSIVSARAIPHSIT